MRLQPVGGAGRIVVRRDPDPDTIRGVVVPVILRQHAVQGVVLAVHAGEWKRSGYVRPPDVRPGDRVLFGKYSGTDVQHDGETLTIMSEDEILAVLEPGAVVTETPAAWGAV